jgi:hypothetical protein
MLQRLGKSWNYLCCIYYCRLRNFRYPVFCNASVVSTSEVRLSFVLFLWRCLSFGMFRRAVWYIITDVSEERAAFIIRVPPDYTAQRPGNHYTIPLQNTNYYLKILVRPSFQWNSVQNVVRILAVPLEFTASVRGTDRQTSSAFRVCVRFVHMCKESVK